MSAKRIVKCQLTHTVFITLAIVFKCGIFSVPPLSTNYSRQKTLRTGGVGLHKVASSITMHTSRVYLNQNSGTKGLSSSVSATSSFLFSVDVNNDLK
jgi:hypothetical protein